VLITTIKLVVNSTTNNVIPDSRHEKRRSAELWQTFGNVFSDSAYNLFDWAPMGPAIILCLVEKKQVLNTKFMELFEEDLQLLPLATWPEYPSLLVRQPPVRVFRKMNTDFSSITEHLKSKQGSAKITTYIFPLDILRENGWIVIKRVWKTSKRDNSIQSASNIPTCRPKNKPK
jgi:hypothetical protein